MQPSVEDLFDRWRSRADSRALAAVFDRTANEVWRVARHLTGRGNEADDLVQATFLAAIESASLWRRELPLVPWLLGILANKLRMKRRRERRQHEAVQRPATAVLREPIDDASHSELLELLQQRLAELPETYRTVLVLQLEHGMSAAEVAHALGRPRATVRSQLHRGLELLRTSLPASVAPKRSDDKPTDLRAVRGAVLLAAGVPTAAATVPIGVTFLMKKLLFVSLALLLGGVWFAWPSTEAARNAPAVAAALPAAAHALPVADPGEVASAPTARTEIGNAALANAPASVAVRVVWSDGNPAAAMAVCLLPTGPHDWFAQRWQDADGAGIARFAPVRAGAYRVRSRHGGSLDVEVVGGEANTFELRIPNGIDVRGTVVDPDGRLVPDAILVLGTSSDDALEATRSNGSGAFFLRSVAATARVAAFADGFGGSQAVSVHDFEKGPIELRLATAAAEVTGRVLDADGRPLAGAWVAHGYADSYAHPDRLLVMRLELTNAAGEFRLQGIPLGLPWPLHIGAEGHAAWKGSVRALAGETPFVEVWLQRGVHLHGVVRNQQGQPVSGIVHVVDSNSPGEGMADQRPQWGVAFAATHEDGAYSFANLSAGKLLVTAHDNHGSVDSRSFSAQAGDDLTWDPLLTHELAILGRLVTDAGAPLAGWRIEAQGDEGVLSPKGEPTGVDGAFRLEGCAPAVYKLRVYAPGDSWYAPILTQRGVQPSADAIELRVDSAAMPTCHVVGRLAADQPAGDWAIVLAGSQGNGHVSSKLEPGKSFTIGPVPAGTYLLQLQGSAAAIGPMVCALGSCALAPGQQHDLGDIRMPPPGEVEVELVDAAGKPVPQAGLLFGLLGAPMGGCGLAIRDGHGVAAFAPGTYLIAYAGEGLCIEHEAIVVRSGQRTSVHLVAAASVHRQVRYDLEAVGWTMNAFATWRKNGVALRRQWFSFWQEKPTPIEEQFTPGAWELELELGSGSVQRFPVVVTGDDTGPAIDIVVTK